MWEFQYADNNVTVDQTAINLQRSANKAYKRFRMQINVKKTKESIVWVEGEGVTETFESNHQHEKKKDRQRAVRRAQLTHISLGLLLKTRLGLHRHHRRCGWGERIGKEDDDPYASERWRI